MINCKFGPIGCEYPNCDCAYPVAWRTFDGEGGYEYRSYVDNENYAVEWAKRNPKHPGWVEPLYTGTTLSARLKALTAKAEAKPCRSPYCECEKDKCTHPGFYDARGT